VSPNTPPASGEIQINDLEQVLEGNGGCYGLYGPRGSGKSWLMLKAIDSANENNGLGLWFPCPSEYKATAFLSSISDNLAHEVERKFILNNSMTNLLNGTRRILFVASAAPIALALVIYLVKGISGATGVRTEAIYSLLPLWLWTVTLCAIAGLLAVSILDILRNNSTRGRLVRAATALRERIRFTASQKYGAEVGLGGGVKSLSGSLKRSQEKALSERPATIASLVFDFRNLVEFIAQIMPGPAMPLN
jgi:hypothetical protein